MDSSVIESIMDRANTRGRLVSQSSPGNKIWIYDCPHWPQKISSYINFCHPNIVMSIEQCSASLSGFVIILEEKKSSHALLRVCIAFSFIGLLTLILYTYYNVDIDLNWKVFIQYIMNLI